METARLKRFAQYARRALLEIVENNLKLVLGKESSARREQPKAVSSLEKEIEKEGREQVTEKVAYIWFNRFCALRFMDLNSYNKTRALSPLPGEFYPEILAEAKAGVMDDDIIPPEIQKKISDLLSGKAPSHDPQNEAYQLLLVAVCNYWHSAMPYLFEKIADYTELLMPTDLLGGNSIPAYVREAMTPETCEDVEVIGWLYQFYISEKKDDVFEKLKKGKKISAENIPAATQLFTPNWIVRYLVENSLGRLWMLNNPESSLVKKMEYYIQPEEAENDFLKINSPEELKICDPACGSGHMLVYAFDLLYSIYEEEGYSPSQIPEKILIHNLFGIEIDERAKELAAFALTMKARSKQKRFFRKKIQPNICKLEKVNFAENELEEYFDFVGKELFTDQLKATLLQFEEADNLGSLIQPKIINSEEILEILKKKTLSVQFPVGNLLETNEKIVKILKQAIYLRYEYDVIISNPPYMRIGNMNPNLRNFSQNHFPSSKADLYAIFIERNLELLKRNGFAAMITMQSWMFLSSYGKLRSNIINNNIITSMAHFGANAFDSIGGEVVSTTAFIINKNKNFKYKGAFFRLTEGKNEAEKKSQFLNNISNPYFSSASDFNEIPGKFIGYWLSEEIKSAFNGKKLSNNLISEGAVKTGDNYTYLRFLWEVSKRDVSINGLWRKHPKGGEFRKWYGNLEWCVNWSIKARKHYKSNSIARIPTETIWNLSGITWTSVASEKPSFRILQNDEIANNSALFVYPKKAEHLIPAICCLNSNSSKNFLNILNPTIQYLVGDILNTPKPDIDFNNNSLLHIGKTVLNISKQDWDSYETSWDFNSLPLLNNNWEISAKEKDSNEESTNQLSTVNYPLEIKLSENYSSLRNHWREMTLETQRLEEENNKIFIEAYELEDELTSEVELKEVTLTCNPAYRYKTDKTEEELEALLKADTIKEFISYSVGCMFGRYSLDKPGLILANQGDSFAEYLDQISEPTFRPTKDNVIPLLEGDWFSDDISEQFKKFLKVTFGKENYEENLKFIEAAIGKKVDKYFLKDFYPDHVKRYKKRPIYWMFSSSKGNFNALIYLHRYQPDNASLVLNYLREFRVKLSAKMEHLEQIGISVDAKNSEKTKALKEIEKLKKIITELEDYEKDQLYPLATEQLEIDLDDGVKVNYKKFGKALKKIAGVS